MSSEKGGLEQEVRTVVARYGYKAVHMQLQNQMREDYLFLQSMMKSVESNVSSESEPRGKGDVRTPHASKVTTLQIQKLPEDGSVAVVSEKKGRRSKKSSKETTPATEASSSETQPVVNTPEEPPVPSEKPSSFKDSAEFKKWQKEQERKKRMELDAQGITVDSLLTRENLTRWLEEEKKTFADIARTYVGCPDTQVSAAAKVYGLKSSVSAKIKSFQKMK